MLSKIWFGMVAAALLSAFATGKLSALAPAALSGAAGAITLCVGLAGALCLWSGVMNVLRETGFSDFLAKYVTAPFLRLFFGRDIKKSDAFVALAENFTSNLLGIGNAATPAGLRAASLFSSSGKVDSLCRLVLLNSCSVQLIPTTVASLRASLGSESPFDIMPGVWFASAISLAAAFGFYRLFSRRVG